MPTKVFGFRNCGVFLTLTAFLLLLFFTHLGAGSPYTYGWSLFDGKVPRIEGFSVNPDMLNIVPLTQYFYEPSPPIFVGSPNTNLPLHSFLASVGVGLFRSYMLGNWILNLLSILLFISIGNTFLERQNISLSSFSKKIVGITFLSLPFFSHYVAQPGQYIVGALINFTLILIALSLDDKDRVNPLINGAIVAVFTLNYDPYVFLGAFLFFLFIFRRFEKKQDYFTFFMVAFLPVMIWKKFTFYISGGGVTTINYDSFMGVIFKSWLEIVKNPGPNFFLPFMAGHVGSIIAFKQVLSYFAWPLSLFVLILAFYQKDQLCQRVKDPIAQLMLLLMVVYLGEQLSTAAFDWENNPRRAIPLLLVFSSFYIFSVKNLINKSVWRRSFVVMMIGGVVLMFSDTIGKTPAFHLSEIGQAIHADPKLLMQFQSKRLRPASLPLLPTDGTPEFFRYPKATNHSEHLAPFVFSQVFLSGVIGSVFLLLVRVRLLNRLSVYWVGFLYFLSLFVRFLS